MLDLPGSGLRHAEATAWKIKHKLAQVIHGAEPEAKRQARRGEDRTGDRRGLAAAGVTLEQPMGPHLAIRPPAASRTFEARLTETF